MIKRVITIALLLCLVFSISVMAEGTTTETTTEMTNVQQKMPEVNIEKPAGEQNGMGTPPSGEMPSRGTPTFDRKGERPSGDFTPPEGFDPSKNMGNFTSPQNRGEGVEGFDNKPDMNADRNNTMPENNMMPENAEESQMQGDITQFGGEMPGNMPEFFRGFQNNNQNPQEQQLGVGGFIKEYSTPITSIILLICAYVFVFLYKRKHY